MSGGGGGMQAKKQDSYSGSSISKLTSSISADQGIDEESKAELIKGLSEKTRRAGDGSSFIAGTDFRTLSGNVEKAREGTDPLYATRRLFQNRRQSVLSQPGRAQTVLTR